MRKGILFLLAVSALLTVTAAGCSKNKGNFSDEAGNSTLKGKVKIRFYESTDVEQISKDIVSSFNAGQDDIEVELSVIPNDDYDDKIKTLLAGGGDMVDVFYLRQLSQAKQYEANKITKDLSPYLKNTTLDISRFGSTLSIVQDKNGQTYAFPRAKNNWYLFYNKKIFDDEGIPYPSQLSWKEYAGLAAKLTKVKKDGQKQWGGYFPPWTLNLYALQSGEHLTDDDLSHTKEALEFLNRIYNVDKSHMGTAEMTATASNPNPEFESGNVAMMINGDWTFLLLGQDEKNKSFGFDWDMAPLPVPDGVPSGVTVGSFSYMAVNAQSKHADAAWKFIEYYCGLPGAVIFAKHGSCPAYMSNDVSDEYVKSTGHQSASLIFKGNTYCEENENPYYKEIRKIFDEDSNLYLLGDDSIDDCMKKFEQQRKEVLSR